MADKNLESLYNGLKKFNRENISCVTSIRYKTGFSGFDALLGGGFSSGLTVLGALPGLGKSTFMFQTAMNIASGGVPVLIFSMEMSETQIIAKYISHETFMETDEKKAVTANDLLNAEKSGKFTDETWKIIEKAVKKIKKPLENIYVIERNKCDANTKKISEITDSFIEREGKKPIVIVDYLQILNNGEKSFGDKQMTDVNITEMSALSLKHNIPVILISSVGRSSYGREITLGSYKESGNIEYSADVLIAIQFKNKQNSVENEKSKFPREVEISLLKHRFGPIGSVAEFNYYAPYDTFIEKNSSSEIEKSRGKGKKTRKLKSNKNAVENNIEEMKRIYEKLEEVIHK